MEKLSTTLKHLLNEANISEAELARRTGIAQPMVNRLATGKNKNPKLETLKPIAKYFSVTFSQLLGEESLPNGKHSADQFNNTSDAAQAYQLPVVNWNKLEQESIDFSSEKMIATTTKVSNSAFAVQVTTNDYEPRFPVNTTLTIEPHTQPNTNSFVLIKNKNKVTLAQVTDFIDHEQSQQVICKLLSNNNQTTVTTNQEHILGTLVHTQYNF